MQERLQKIIARAGITSRRAAEELILAGRVRVDGHVITELGAKADPHDAVIEVDGKRLVSEAPRYIVLHKPRGVVSTLSDPEGRPTVGELLEAAGLRLYPVGRLDFATSGVLLATNDGDFANGLLHPRGGVPKTYVLKVKGNMKVADLDRWAEGVQLEDGPTQPAEVRLLRHEEDKTWFEITIREGRNQQIRRMGEATGFPVMRLARTHFAGIDSEGLRPGDYRSLTVAELEELRQRFGVPKRIRGAVLGEHNEAPRRPRRVPAPHRDEAPRRAPRHVAGGDEAPRRAPRHVTGADEAPRRAPRSATSDEAPRDRVPRGEGDRDRASGRARSSSLARDRSAAPARDRSSSPARERSSSPARDRAPARDRSASPDRERGPARDRDRAPARDRSSAPDRERGPARDRDRAPARDRSASPARDRAPARDRSAAPSRERSSSPAHDRDRRPARPRDDAPRPARGGGGGSRPSGSRGPKRR